LQVLAFKGDQLVSKSGGRIASLEKKTENQNGMPKINASQALITALKSKNINLQIDPLVVSSEQNGHYVSFDHMNIMRENITANLMWVPLNDGKKVEL
jgi:beta-lactamase superfamily II metal-dependent hydrolase